MLSDFLIGGKVESLLTPAESIDGYNILEFTPPPMPLLLAGDEIFCLSLGDKILVILYNKT